MSNEQRRGWITKEDGRNIVTLLLVAIIVMLILKIDRQESVSTNIEAEVEEITAPEEIAVATDLRPFDPNTASLGELRLLGMSRTQALSVIRYREFIHHFRIKEELTSCYEIDDSLYYALEPYITIGEEFRYKKSVDTIRRSTPHDKPTREYLTPTKFLVDTVGSRYLHAIGALSPRQAEVFVKWRDMSGIHSEEELRECYTISDSVASWLMQYVIFTPRSVATPPSTPKKLVDLNRADSATLRSVSGIGEKSVVEILAYRKKLGGFHSVEQLSELFCITEGNFRKIITQIFADSCDISKIDVNFASAKIVSSHPYLKSRARKLLKMRELKGGWSRLEELIEDNIFTMEEAQRVRPYLHFESKGVD